MTRFTMLLLAGTAMVALGGAPAQAALSLSAIQGGAASGATLFNLDDLTVGTGSPQTTFGTGGAQMTVVLTPDARVAVGSLSGQYAAPFISGSNGAGFGNAPGQDTTPYLTSGRDGHPTLGASVQMLLGGAFQYFGLLWGSIDDFNKLEFFNGNVSVGVITGADVTANPNGDQGVSGTRYVNITSTLAFDRVVATSTQYAFEFDNVALSATPIPEPASLALLGLGLLGLGMAARAKRRAA